MPFHFHMPCICRWCFFWNCHFSSLSHNPDAFGWRFAWWMTGGVGKSSLVLRFIKGTFRESYIPTIEDTYRQVRFYRMLSCSFKLFLLPLYYELFKVLLAEKLCSRPPLGLCFKFFFLLPLALKLTVQHVPHKSKEPKTHGPKEKKKVRKFTFDLGTYIVTA